MTLTVDTAASVVFCAELDRYLSVIVDDGEFVGTSRQLCAASVKPGWGFAGGQLSYVGDSYAMRDDGDPLRVLVVAMQVGDGEARSR